MPPLLATPALRADEPEQQTTTLELLLVTLALAASIILALIPTARSLNHTRRPILSALTVLVALLTSAGAIALSIVALILGWTRTISLDALAAVVFALAPALLSIPRQTIKYGYLTFRIRKRTSLCVPTHRFRYIRYGAACGKDGKAANFRSFSKKCKRKDCKVNMYIRCLPARQRCTLPCFPASPHRDFGLLHPHHAPVATPASTNTGNNPVAPTASPNTGINPIAPPASTNTGNNPVAPPASTSTGNNPVAPPAPPPAAPNTGTNPVAPPGPPPATPNTGNNAPTAPIPGDPGNTAPPAPAHPAPQTIASQSTAQHVPADTTNDPPGIQHIQWHGERVGHTTNFVKLRDQEDGITAWWWDSVSSAIDVVDRPRLVNVSNTDNMLNALSLLSDIVSIGDMVLEYRKYFLRDQLKNNRGVSTCITATPGIMCNKIIATLHLDGWGQVENEMSSKPYPKDRQKYTVLFLILCEKSEMFANVQKGVEKGEKEEGDTKLESDALSGGGAGNCCLPSCCGQQKQSSVECRPLISAPNGGSAGRSSCSCRETRRRRQSKKEPISGQDILDTLMHKRNRELPPEQFKQLCRHLTDEWLLAWGCSKTSLEDEDKIKAKLDAQATRGRG